MINSMLYGEGRECRINDGYLLTAVYSDITAKELGTRYVATVHCFDADGNEHVSLPCENTVKDYLITELLNTGNTDAVRTLCADLLNYGAAAQVCFKYDTDHLVNENLSDEAAAAKDQFETKDEAPATLENSTPGPNVYASVSIMNRVDLSLLGRKVNAEGAVTFQVKDNNGAVRAELETRKMGASYIAEFNELEAEDMRTPFTFTILVDGVEYGTPMTWSVEGYVREARLNSNTGEAELALFNALLIYVDSAGAAIGSHK